MATCSSTCESCVGRCLTQSLVKQEKFALWSSVVSSMLVLKNILWASVDGMMLLAVPQLANTKAWLCFIPKFTEASISIVWVYMFRKIYIMRLSLINARDLQLKSITCFQLTPPVSADGVKTSGVFRPFFSPTVTQKRKKSGLATRD